VLLFLLLQLHNKLVGEGNKLLKPRRGEMIIEIKKIAFSKPQRGEIMSSLRDFEHGITISYNNISLSSLDNYNACFPYNTMCL